MQLALLEDRLERQALSLDAADRVLYVVSGNIEAQDGRGATALGANEAWYGDGASMVHARGAAVLWRWELRDGAPRADSGVVKLAPGHPRAALRALQRARGRRSDGDRAGRGVVRAVFVDVLM